MPVLRLSDVVAGNDLEDTQVQPAPIDIPVAPTQSNSAAVPSVGVVAAPAAEHFSDKVTSTQSVEETPMTTPPLQTKPAVQQPGVPPVSQKVVKPIVIQAPVAPAPQPVVPVDTPSQPDEIIPDTEPQTVAAMPETERDPVPELTVPTNMLALADTEDALVSEPTVVTEPIVERVTALPVIGYDIPDMWDTAAIKTTAAPVPPMKVVAPVEVIEPEAIPIPIPTPTTPPIQEPEPVVARIIAADPPPKKAQVSGASLASLRERILHQSMSTTAQETPDIGAHTTDDPVSSAPNNNPRGTEQIQDVQQVKSIPAINTEDQLGEQNTIVPRAMPDSTHARAIAQAARSLRATKDTIPPSPSEDLSITPEMLGAEISIKPQSTLSSAVRPVGTQAPTQSTSSIRTLKSDVANMVTHNKTSVVDMISAEEQKKGTGATTVRIATQSRLTSSSYMLIGASAALLIGAVIVAFVYFFSRTVDTAQLPKSFFFPEQTQVYDATNKQGNVILTELAGLRDSVDVRVGFVAEIRVEEKMHLVTTNVDEVNSVPPKSFFERIGAHTPSTLTRAISNKMMLGFYRSNKNQPYIIFNVDNYENAFSGMLEWETVVAADLSPLFDTGLSAKRAPVNPLAVILSATTTAGTSTAPAYIPSSELFEDRTVANVPTRVHKDASGNVVLLWSMPDNATVIITTNEDVFENILGRMTVRQY